MIVSTAVRSLVFLLVIALASQTAEAQTCAGAASFANGNVRIGLGGGSIGTGIGSADGNSAIGVQVAAGSSRGAFASAAGALAGSTKRFLREGFAASGSDDALSRTMSVNGGYSMAAPSLRHVEFCPIAGFAVQSGPQMWGECSPLPSGGLSCSDGIEGAARAMWVGGSVGRLHQVSPKFAFVPFAGAALVNSRISARQRSQTDSYVDLNLGVGFVFMRTTVRSAFSVPVGLEGAKTSGGIQFAFNIGPKRVRESD